MTTVAFAINDTFYLSATPVKAELTYSSYGETMNASTRMDYGFCYLTVNLTGIARDSLGRTHTGSDYDADEWYSVSASMSAQSGYSWATATSTHSASYNSMSGNTSLNWSN